MCVSWDLKYKNLSLSSKITNERPEKISWNLSLQPVSIEIREVCCERHKLRQG